MSEFLANKPRKETAKVIGTRASPMSEFLANKTRKETAKDQTLNEPSFQKLFQDHDGEEPGRAKEDEDEGYEDMPDLIDKSTQTLV